jgi:glycosyltransferase involved in cell wall biosynthesis
LSFLGNYKHPPNAEGIEWFVRTVMPLVQTAVPDAKLSIYGARMPETIKALESQNVLAKGFVENTSDAYNPHKIFVAPLLSGAGIKGKVVAALAHGIPCVLTPVAAEGIGLRHGLDCMIATDPKEWVDAISELYGDPSKWLQISNNARTYVEETFSMVKGRQELRAAFEAVDIYNSLD